MAKFRSWNETLNKFFYWEDGEYCGGTDSEDEQGETEFLFNWQNAEQSTIIVDVMCSCGDTLIVSFAYNKYNEPDNQIEKSVKGVLKIDNMGFYIESQEDKIYLSSLPTIFDCAVIGNIHENKEHENDTQIKISS